MPKGKHLKAQREQAATVRSAVNSMTRLLQDELETKGSDVRAEILASFDDTLAAVEALAHGIIVESTKGGDKVVYSLPPHWPALKWLADWGRQILKQEATTVQEHRIDPETAQMMKDFIEEGRKRPAVIESEGVYQLGSGRPGDNGVSE
jgi:hypothetical protein